MSDKKANAKHTTECLENNPPYASHGGKNARQTGDSAAKARLDVRLAVRVAVATSGTTTHVVEKLTSPNVSGRPSGA
jgi:hypothetical protein